MTPQLSYRFLLGWIDLLLSLIPLFPTYPTIPISIMVEAEEMVVEVKEMVVELSRFDIEEPPSKQSDSVSIV